MKIGTCVRLTDAYKKKMLLGAAPSTEKGVGGPYEHIKEFGDCVGVIQGATFSDPAPELDVRWHISNLRYSYSPGELEVALPVSYYEDFVTDPDRAFLLLQGELDWERRGDAPRSEYYCNDVSRPYIYGRGKGRRLYEPRPYHPVIMEIRHELEKRTDAVFEVCFLNRYLDQSDQLGWHADDSPEMDDGRPIVSVSLGVAREIWFREKPLALVEVGEDQRSSSERRWYERTTKQRRMEPLPTSKLLLGDGSACIMAPGMQDTHQHRIPKAGFKCGERISLTFRGYIQTKV